jgi:UDP-GlcNAc3NAcA epimerase
MSAVFFEEMDIPTPAYNLDINGMSHGAMTGEMLLKLEDVLRSERPDLVLVYGDTNSTLAGALAAKKLGLKLVHVEAGLRSFNMKMPEEVNRLLTDQIADLLLCPTPTAVTHLKNEGVDRYGATIQLCGDIMKDAVDHYREKAKSSTILQELNAEPGSFVLTTIHRQENTGDPQLMTSLFQGLERIGRHKRVILPLHPGTVQKMKLFGLKTSLETIEPVSYFDMLRLLEACDMVVTDSGGLQKEAYFHKKPCIIARNETEWVELVEAGYAVLTGTDATALENGFLNFTETRPQFESDLYGTGVGEKIHAEILKLA